MDTPPGHGAARRGLTLVEVAISLSLLTLLIFPLYSLLFTSRQAVGDARHHQTARLAIEHQLERMRSLANADQGTTFAALATTLRANPTFTVADLPGWTGRTWTGSTNGRIRVCLDETKRWFANDEEEGAGAHDDYFAAAPFDRIAYPTTLDPAAGTALNLDASLDLSTTPPTPTFTALAPTAAYRVLPVRVEVYWGAERSPRVAVNAVIGPKTNFRRG